MIRRRTILAVSVVVFCVTFVLAKGVLRQMGPHTWHRAHVELNSLQLCIDLYQQEHGKYPEEDVVDSWIDYIWSNEGDINHLHDNEEFEALSVMYSNTTYHRLSRWGAPYIYCVGQYPGRSWILYIRGRRNFVQRR